MNCHDSDPKLPLFLLLLLAGLIGISQPEVHVKGNGYDIFDAAATWPDSTGQAFGVLQANVDSVSKNYWIYNTGNTPLTLSNFRVTAVYNAHFNITPPSTLVVPAGDSVFFTVQYKPTAAGTHGRLTGGSGVCVAAFDSDDSDEPIYDFRISGTATADPAFDCSSGRMFFSHLGGGTDLKEWHYAEQPPTLSTISNALTWNHDGMGMNPNDNYIYTMRYNGGARHQLWVLSSNGVANFVGYVSGGGITANMGAHAGGGAMDNNNNLYAFYNADATSSLKRINVKSQQAEEITLSSPVHARSAIYNPSDGLLYAMSAGATNDGLVSVDPSNGNVTLIGGNGDLTHAAMFRSSDGTVYMMSQTYNMYTVDLSTGAITQVAENPGWGNGTWVDGCACGDISLEADLAITKSDNRPSYVPGAINTYTIAVTNAGPHGAYQATVQDLVPTGITPANVSWYSTTYGTATSTTTSGTGDLNDVIDLGVGDSIVYTVRIIVDNGFTGNLSNIAIVTAPSFLTDPNAANNTATDINVPTSSATEECNNGFDDDGDGEVDCFDGDCAGNAVCVSHFTNGVIPACPDTPDVAAFSMQLQWSSSQGRDYITPVVGDMDGDGLPEVVTVNYGNGRVYVLNGQDGSVITNIAYQGVYHNFSGGAAIADIDNDGTAEIFLVTGNAQSGAAGLNCRQWISCFDYDNGALTQRYRKGFGRFNIDEYSDQKWAVVQFADFDEDGITEIFVGNHVMNSATGDIIASPTVAQRNNWPRGRQLGGIRGDYMSAAYDVLPDAACANCDGLELICGNTVYAVDLSDPTNDQNGITVATQMTPTGTYTDGLTSLADWDGNGEMDIIVTGRVGGIANFYIWDPRADTVIIDRTNLPNGGDGSGRAAVADFDGDGANELAIVTKDRLLLYESDGTLKWSNITNDNSAKTSATAFDFEGDGDMEIIYRDQDTLFILDGVTGNTKTGLPCQSGTRVEMPVVVDVDSDGEAEICVSCGTNTRVYASDQTPWMPTRKVWNSIHYVPTFINDDLTIPAQRQPKATTSRMDIYAAQVPITDPSGNLIYPALPDFTITIDSSTVGNCTDDSTAVHVTICNDDAPSLIYDYPLSFYNGDPNSGGTLLGTRWVTLANTTFTRDSCYYFTFNAANQPTDLYVMLNDSGTGTFGFPTTHLEECDSTNNQANADVGCAIDAGITKDDGQLSYIPGGPVTYTIIAKNNGPNFTGGVVSDPLPAGVSAGDVSWTATTHGGATTTAVGTMNGALQDTVDIPGGDSITYLVTIATPASLVGDLVNTVTITVTGDTITTNNTATDTDTVDCTFSVTGTVNSRAARWSEIGTVRSGLTYNFGTSGGFKTFTAKNGPENGNVISTVIFNTGTNQHVSLTKNKYTPANNWLATVGIYDNTPHGWTGLSGVAPENAPILGFMAFVDQNGNGTFDSGVEEYIRDINSLSITPSTTGQLYMAFYDDGPYNDNSGSLTINASVTASTISLGNDTTFCSGNSVTLDAENAGATYLWNTGATSQTIVAGATGQYNVTVNTGGGCLVRDTINIIVDTVTVSLGNDTSFCAGDSITLDAENAGATYLWSTGDTSQTIVAKSVGQYFVRVTNSDGCIGRDTMNITSLITLPVVNLGNDTTICAGTSLTLDAQNPGATYTWNDSSTNQTLVANAVGTYFVAVTSAGGCLGRDTMDITGFSPALAVDLGNDTTICANDSLTLDAGNPGSTYLWNDASTNPTLVISAVGTYFVEVTSSGGCLGRDTMNLTALDTLPFVNLGPSPTTICAGSSLTLDAGNPGATYLWHDNSANQTFAANGIGKYYVTVTTGAGCSATDTMDITGTAVTLDVNLGNDTSICIGSTYILNANNSGANFEWNDGSTGQTLAVNSAGQYYVKVTDPSGCEGHDTVNIGINPLPIVDLLFDVAVCSDAPAFALYNGSPTANPPSSTGIYSGPGISSSPTFDPSMAGAGNHIITYTYTDANGCSNSASDTIPVHGLPNVNLGPDRSFCENSSTTLDAENAGATFIWNNGGSTQTIAINSPGTYDVIVIDDKGCIGQDTISVNTIPAPAVSLGNDINICSGTTTLLDAANPGSSYLWNDGSAGQTLNINAPGQYYVAVTGANGCIGRDTMTLLGFHTLPLLDLGPNTTICNGSTLTLDPGNTGATFLWQDGSTGTSFDATTLGKYWVQVTDGNGCISSDTITVTGFSNSLDVPLGNDTALCSGISLTLNAGNSGASYLWNDGSTAQTLLVNAVGTYHVRVTDATGCMGHDTLAITNIYPTPTVDLGTDRSICSGSSLTLDAENAGATYLWNDGSTNQTLLVNSAGTYQVTVTNGNGCVGTDDFTVTAVHPTPTLLLGNDRDLCSGNFLTLDAENIGANYLWNDGSTNQTLTVSAAGLYHVLVSTTSGCTARDSLTITAINPSPVVDLGNDLSICSGSSFTLDAENPGASYIWNDGSANQTLVVNSAGNYYVTVTAGNGCTSSDTMALLNVYDLPVINLGPDTSLCSGTNLTLNAGTGLNSYLWNDGSNASTLVVNAAGLYHVTVGDLNGCLNSDTMNITAIHPLPVVIVNDEIMCPGDPDVTFTANSSTAMSYLWSENGTGNQSTTTGNAAGNYTVKVSDSNGCEAAATGLLTWRSAPTVSVESKTICLGDSAATFTAVAPSATSFTWSENGSGTASSTKGSVEGNYTVTVSNGTCSSSATGTLTVQDSPVIDLGGDLFICQGESKTISAKPFQNITWNNSVKSATFTVDTTLSVHVSVVDGYGCMGQDSLLATLVPAVEMTPLRPDTTLCENGGDQILLEVTNQNLLVEWQDGQTGLQYYASSAGEYIATVRDENDCMTKDTVILRDSCSSVIITIPTIFTPGGETNDPLVPIENPEDIIPFVTYIDYTVYNRWGMVMFHSQDVLPYWNGIDMNSNKACPTGVYFWVLNYTSVRGENIKSNGFVQLIRKGK